MTEVVWAGLSIVLWLVILGSLAVIGMLGAGVGGSDGNAPTPPNEK